MQQATIDYIKENKDLLLLLLSKEADETTTVRIELLVDGPLRLTIELIAGELLEVLTEDAMLGTQYFPHCLAEKAITLEYIQQLV